MLVLANITQLCLSDVSVDDVVLTSEVSSFFMSPDYPVIMYVVVCADVRSSYLCQ